MLVSPFTFYRGAALIMAADLAGTPETGIRAQVCGDCHLLNFGGFATPERRVIFDINDFDETLPGPWEWDVKRLAASFVLAARSNGFCRADQRDAALACVRAYRERMAEYRRHARARRLVRAHRHGRRSGDAVRRRERGTVAQAPGQGRGAHRRREATSRRWWKAAAAGSSSRTIRRSSTTTSASTWTSSRDNICRRFAAYRKTLPDDRRVLLDRYRMEDFALKVVGVGSVGTFCAVMLMMADDDDPLFLQVKEARASVLEPYVGKSPYANHGAARRGRPAPDAVGERHLPRLDAGQGEGGTSTCASCAT